MNKQIEALKMEQEVPLTERLKKVPENARLIVDSADGMSSSVHAVGYLCHKAAEALAKAEKQDIGEAEIRQMLKEIEWCHQEIEKKKWQSLSDDEIVKTRLKNQFGKFWFVSFRDGLAKQDVDITGFENELKQFARAIEQALKEKNT